MTLAAGTHSKLAKDARILPGWANTATAMAASEVTWTARATPNRQQAASSHRAITACYMTLPNSPHAGARDKRKSLLADVSSVGTDLVRDLASCCLAVDGQQPGQRFRMWTKGAPLRQGLLCCTILAAVVF